MAGDFLPDYSSKAVDGRYRPIFKLFASDRWSYVRNGKEPVLCDSSAEATKLAKAYVQRILNPEIRAEIAAAPDVDDLGVEAWRNRRAEEIAAQQERTLGIIIARGGRQVQVERKRRRA